MSARATTELISQWRLLWLDSIEYVASLELQRVAWLNPLNTNPHWSFVELLESYFEQFGLRDGYGYALESGMVSSAEFAAVRAFHEAISRYRPPNGDRYDHPAILRDPNWMSVVSEAAQAVDRLLGLSFNGPDYIDSFPCA